MAAPALNRALSNLGQRQDLVLVVLIVAAIMMMILPLPTWMVDILIAVNMTFTVLLLMVAIYLKRPIDLPVLPAVILIATVFRLALSITTTRLILLQANAGHIIETFGEFVIAGSLVVGLVIFAIITVVQFVVITKGAERVAEVGARFTLDAIPGKQMSIDAELRNGDLTKEEARRRRTLLERESQLYGAMDGAMKFVKGDAIAGLVITAINLLGGMIIGTMQLDFSVSQAAQVYSLLTVGDGLVAQIPALFVSIAASAVVTRVSDETSSNLGSDIATHLLREVQPLELAAAVVFLLGMVPGFPTLIFATLSAFLIGFALVRRFDPTRREAVANSEVPRLEGVAPIKIKLASRLADGWQREDIRRFLEQRMEDLSEELGLPLPVPRLELLPGGAGISDLTVEIEEVPVARSVFGKPTAAPAASEATGRASVASVLRLPGRGDDRVPENDPLLMRAGDITTAAVRRHVDMLIGLEQTKQVLDRARRSDSTLVEEALRHLPIPKFCGLYRQLLAEGLTLRHQRNILEAVVALGADGSDIPGLADRVRIGLNRQLSHAHAAADGRLHAILLPEQLETALRSAVREGGNAPPRGPSPELTRDVVAFVKNRAEAAGAIDAPIVLTAFDLRRHLRSLLMQHAVTLPVLAFDEVAPGFEITSIGLPSAPRSAEAAPAPEAAQ